MIDEPCVVEALRDVIDPELGMDVIELGMVGGVEIDEPTVHVHLRLTSMSCPFWDLFVDQVRTALRDVEGVDAVKVSFDRRNPWSPELMSERAHAQLEATGLMPPRFGAPRDRGELLQMVDGVLSAPQRRT